MKNKKKNGVKSRLFAVAMSAVLSVQNLALIPIYAASPEYEKVVTISQPERITLPEREAEEPEETISPQRETAAPERITSPKRGTTEPKETTLMKRKTAKLEETALPERETTESEETTSPERETTESEETTSPESETTEPEETTSPEHETTESEETTSPESETAEPEETTSPESETEEPEETTSPESETAEPEETSSQESETAEPKETTSPEEEQDPTGTDGSTAEALPSDKETQEEVICTCDPDILKAEGIHTSVDCPLYGEPVAEGFMMLMDESDNDFWDAPGRYNADWEGLTDYSNTNEFTITDASDLAAFTIVLNANNSNTFKGKTITLEADIDLSGHLWDMRGGISRTGGNGNFFAGTFDGGGHTISGMTIDYDNAYVGMGSDFGNFGLFADLNGATVRDLTIADTQITIGYVAPSFPTGVGVLCGSVSGSTIEDVSVVNATITQKENLQGSSGFYFGGIAGIEFSPFTRTPSNQPNTYTNCTVDDLSITYSQPVNGNWTSLMGFGGMIGGVFPMGADPTYQSAITDCNISNVSIQRNLAADSFVFECYGGVIGFSPYPVIIENTHVTDLSIDFGAPTGNTKTTILGPPFATAMIGGLIGYGERSPANFPSRTSSINGSSASGSITADNQANLLPVYVGGLIGVNNGVTVTDCYTQLDFTGMRDKDAVIYGNLFGLLQTRQDQGVTIRNSIFNNHDYIATDAEIDAPSTGYVGEKLSTFSIAGELNNIAAIDLSQNWGILKYVLIMGEKAPPLEYVQCSEKTAEMDFYDHWTVDSYTHKELTQDSDTAQVTFAIDSGKDTFPMGAEITSISGSPTWDFAKDILVLPDRVLPGPTYTVTYLPGAQGSFAPQKYNSLHAGDKTPSFNGTPTGNPNWYFDGWQPVVSETVTADATYTAKWIDKTGGGGEPPSGVGNLSITKNVSGNGGNITRDFTFQVIVEEGGSYSYTGSRSGTIKSGESLMLHHGESITIEDIPAGRSYLVVELEANQDGYSTTATGDKGNILENKTVTAVFNNQKFRDSNPSSPNPKTPKPNLPEANPPGPIIPEPMLPEPVIPPLPLAPIVPMDPDMPKTGNAFNSFGWLCLWLFSGMGMVTTFLSRCRRHRDESSR